MKYVVVVFSILIAVGCFWAGFKMVRLYWKVKSWDRVEATILEKKAEYRKKHANSGTAVYIATMRYEYKYQGENYEGNTVYLEELVGGSRSFRKQQVQNLLNRLGEKKLIYVNPSNPATSVVFCNGMGLYFLMLGGGVLSLLIGLIYLVKK
jgi:hypothetical protein